MVCSVEDDVQIHLLIYSISLSLALFASLSLPDQPIPTFYFRLTHPHARAEKLKQGGKKVKEGRDIRSSVDVFYNR